MEMLKKKALIKVNCPWCETGIDVLVSERIHKLLVAGVRCPSCKGEFTVTIYGDVLPYLLRGG